MTRVQVVLKIFDQSRENDAFTLLAKLLTLPSVHLINNLVISTFDDKNDATALLKIICSFSWHRFFLLNLKSVIVIYVVFVDKPPTQKLKFFEAQLICKKLICLVSTEPSFACSFVGFLLVCCNHLH